MDLNVDGHITAKSKSFLIKHPLEDNFALKYGSLEGPEHGVYYRGKLENETKIILPNYWKYLIDEQTITVNLTPFGSSQNLYVKNISSSEITIGNANLLKNTANCFYIVFAERKDIKKLITEYPIS